MIILDFKWNEECIGFTVFLLYFSYLLPCFLVKIVGNQKVSYGVSVNHKISI